MKQKKTSGMSFRLCATLLALALVLGCGIGGTLAWLTAQTDPVVNTFTVGDIDIELYESQYNPTTNELDYSKEVTSNTYKIVPGMVLPKDPMLRLKKGSEPCWLFIKVEEVNFIEGIHYGMFTKQWTKLSGETGVYYCEYSVENVKAAFENGVIKEEKNLQILDPEEITISGDITKEDMADIDGNVELNFTAYAVQHYGFETAADAWAVVKSTYPDQFPSGSED